ncbi:hypothetical protein HanXRQr2_Chr05g0231801 [Helianthus annuus]|uniref:Uncharacterized protein n=1 Tax=Helianthus annuus TaxID=4232 RepID=A0A9K3NNX8_HELAN|nr:hypothetical protein HanXRQr2_Chr05g0231801 [Helianthus annuus]KAJ0924033.1 hypothetical protein HanPSC8_Chr05g0223571 [Helianthus annuus]
MQSSTASERRLSSLLSESLLLSERLFDLLGEPHDTKLHASPSANRAA